MGIVECLIGSAAFSLCLRNQSRSVLQQICVHSRKMRKFYVVQGRQMIHHTPTGVGYSVRLPVSHALGNTDAVFPNPPSVWALRRKNFNKNIKQQLLTARRRRQHSPKGPRNNRRAPSQKSRARRNGHLGLGPGRNQHVSANSGPIRQPSRDEQPHLGPRSQSENNQPRVARVGFPAEVAAKPKTLMIMQNTSGDVNISSPILRHEKETATNPTNNSRTTR